MMDFDELEEKETNLAQVQLQDSCGAVEADRPALRTPRTPRSPRKRAVERQTSAPGEEARTPVPADKLVPEPEEPSSASAPLRSEQSREGGAAEGGAAGAPAGTGIEQEAKGGAKPSSSEGKHKDGLKDHGGPAPPPATFAPASTWDVLDRRCNEVQAVKNVADYLNMSPLVVATAGSMGAALFLLYGFGGQLLCTVLGYLYPAFESFKAAERSMASEMQLWLMYWVVFSIFVTVEHFTYYIITWVPFYYPLKLAGLMWLFHPATRGARFVYRWFLLPVLQRNQEKIDAAIEESSQQLKKGVSGALTGAVGAGLNTAMAAGAGAVPKVRSLSALALEALLTKKVPLLQEQDDDQ